MLIFSERSRTDATPKGHREGSFTFLDRIAGAYWDQVRELVEEWFTHVPETERPDLRSRLRSKDDRQGDAAFFELYLHESLRRAGYAVEFHPEVTDTPRRPDFLATKGDSRLYVEATIPSASDESVRQNKITSQVYDVLDKTVSPNFYLWIMVQQYQPAAPRVAPLRRELGAWLDTLDPDDVDLATAGSRRELPTFEWSRDGWTIEFRAVPKPRARRGDTGNRPLGIFGGDRASFVDDVSPLRSAIDRKGRAYGALEAPFVVAVATTSVTSDDDDVVSALYGTERFQQAFDPDGHELWVPVRAPDGYWRSGGNTWDHRHVSGVLIARNVYAAFVARQTHTLWVHPDPLHDAPQLPMWGSARVRDGALERTPALSEPHTFFSLPEAWPEGEPFPR